MLLWTSHQYKCLVSINNKPQIRTLFEGFNFKKVQKTTASIKVKLSQ